MLWGRERGVFGMKERRHFNTQNEAVSKEKFVKGGELGWCWRPCGGTGVHGRTGGRGGGLNRCGMERGAQLSYDFN